MADAPAPRADAISVEERKDAVPVAKVQRVDDGRRKLDACADAVVKQDLQPGRGADPQMMPAMAADMEVGLELAMKQHLIAGRAFLP